MVDDHNLQVGSPTPCDAAAFWALNSQDTVVDRPDRPDLEFLFRSIDPDAHFTPIAGAEERHRSLKRLARIWVDRNCEATPELLGGLNNWVVGETYFNEVVLAATRLHGEAKPTPDQELEVLFRFAPATIEDIELANANSALLAAVFPEGPHR